MEGRWRNNWMWETTTKIRRLTTTEIISIMLNYTLTLCTSLAHVNKYSKCTQHFHTHCLPLCFVVHLLWSRYPWCLPHCITLRLRGNWLIFRRLDDTLFSWLHSILRFKFITSVLAPRNHQNAIFNYDTHLWYSI